MAHAGLGPRGDAQPGQCGGSLFSGRLHETGRQAGLTRSGKMLLWGQGVRTDGQYCMGLRRKWASKELSHVTAYRCLEIVLQDSFCKVRVYSQRVVKEKACRAWECYVPRDPVPHHVKQKNLAVGSSAGEQPPVSPAAPVSGQVYSPRLEESSASLDDLP